MSTMRTLMLCCLLAGSACEGAPLDEEPVGLIELAISNVPSDVLCVQITVSDGLRSTIRKVPGIPGQSLTATLSALPVGPVSVAVDAFDVACGNVTPSSAPTWVSGVVQTILTGAAPVMLSVNMSRPGRASIDIEFPGTTPPGALTVSPSSATFAATAVGSPSSVQAFTVTNSGAAPVSLIPSSDAVGTSDYFTPQTDQTCLGITGKLSVGAGSSCILKVGFRPTALGTRAGTVSFGTAGTANFISIAVTGTGVPPVSVIPSIATFAPQVVGTQSGLMTLMVTNNGPAMVTLVPSGDAVGISDYFFVPTGQTCLDPTGRLSVAAGGTCTLRMGFRPTALGTRAGTVSFGAGSINGFSIAAAGTGVPAVTVSPSSATFPSQAVGTPSSPQSFTVTNRGATPVTLIPSGDAVGISDYFFGPSDQNCLEITGRLSLAAGSSCVLELAFRPTALGTRAGTVSFGAGTVNLISITVTGTGTPPITVSPSSATFAAQKVGSQSSPMAFTVTNNGPAMVTLIPSGDAVGISDYLLVQTDQTCLGPTLKLSVAAGATCLLRIAFRPTAIGTRAGTVSFGAGSVNSFSISLSGTGTEGASTTLVVNDNLPAGCVSPNCNRDKWSMRTDFGAGATPFGDRTFTVDSVGSSSLDGRPWIRTAADSKNFDGSPLATLTSNATAVLLLIDDRHNGAGGRPPWLTDAGFVDQGFNVVVRQSPTATFPYSVWRKPVTPGSTVALPRVGSAFSAAAPGYFVVLE